VKRKRNRRRSDAGHLHFAYFYCMTREEKITFKTNLKQFCQALIEQRIQTTRGLINDAQQAANSEEKSSAGDKYETARAMGHMAKDMHARQLAEHLKELAHLQEVNVTEIYNAVSTGAFVQCSNIALFIAAGAGKQVVDGRQVLFLSPTAPLAQLIKNKKVGDSFMLNGVSMVIEEVF